MEIIGNQAPETEAARDALGIDGMLSIVMPAYNLGRCIRANVAAVARLFDGKIPFEIVPVDDGSPDNTAAEIRAAAAEARADTVRPVLLERNAGKGAALAAGFAASRGTFVLLLDGDLDLDPAFVWKFFKIMREKNADIVIGSKLHPESQIDYPLRRRIASAVYYGIVKLLVGLPVRDTQTGMKLFRREALQYALERMLAKRFAFDLEVLAIAAENGCKIAEAPIRLDFHGKAGSLTWTNVRQVMTDTLAIFYRAKVLRYYRSIERNPFPAEPPKVSVVVACPSVETACMRECLAGLAEQRYPAMEVLLLPDAFDAQAGAGAGIGADAGADAGDDGAARLRVPGAELRILPTGKVRPAEKRNIGIAAATGEIVAFLDDDARPLAGWLEHAVPYFSSPDAGAVGGPAVTPRSDGRMSALGGLVYANIFVSGAYRRRYVPTRVCSEEDLPSCNLLVRKALLDKLGGFASEYWPGEDTVLCLRLTKELGARMVYDPRVAVEHHRRPLFGPHLRQVSRYARHRGFFARKFPSTSRKLSYMLPSLFVIGAATGLPLVLATQWIVWRGLIVAQCLEAAYLCVMVLYLALTCLSCMALRDPRRWATVWAGVVATHFAYGINFMRGLFSSGMEREVKPFDHHSGLHSGEHSGLHSGEHSGEQQPE